MVLGGELLKNRPTNRNWGSVSLVFDKFLKINIALNFMHGYLMMHKPYGERQETALEELQLDFLFSLLQVTTFQKAP
jgi:hypothetical protein